MNDIYFITKDQFIASTLFAFQMKLNSIDRKNGCCYFVFENKKLCIDMENRYYSGELSINPRLVFDAFRSIKSIIYTK